MSPPDASPFFSSVACGLHRGGVQVPWAGASRSITATRRHTALFDWGYFWGYSSSAHPSTLSISAVYTKIRIPLPPPNDSRTSKEMRQRPVSLSKRGGLPSCDLGLLSGSGVSRGLDVPTVSCTAHLQNAESSGKDPLQDADVRG